MRYRLGLVAEPLPGDEQFAGMLAFPYITRAGPKSVKFRALRDSGPKYLAHTGAKPRLYNTMAYFGAWDVIGIAEGEPDAIAATEHLGVPTLGVPGAKMWHAHKRIWAPVFRDFPRVLVFGDGDDAGRELAGLITETLGWRVRVIQCPAGEDVCSMIAGGQAGVLQKRVKLIRSDDAEN